MSGQVAVAAHASPAPSSPTDGHVLFPTIDFAIFFAVVYTVQWLLNPYPGPWKAFMVVASYFFYAWWDWRFIFLLAASTAIAQVGGRLVHRASGAPPEGRALGPRWPAWSGCWPGSSTTGSSP